MASSSRPKRPSAGSRTPTSRPRKVAGRSPSTPEAPETPEAPSAEESPPEEQQGLEESEPVTLEKQFPEVEEQTEPEPEPEPATESLIEEPRRSRRSTPILVAAIIALVLVVSAEIYYLVGPPAEAPVVSTSRPVVASELDRANAVDTAAASIEKIVARSYETYDEQVDAATATMTEAFAAQYRETTGEIKASFVEAKTEVTVTVVAQAVMTASPEQAQVLLFLNQFVTKDGGEALYSPYRAVATMVNTDQGWLVSKLETR